MGPNNQIVLCKRCGRYITDEIGIPPSPTPHLHRTLQAPDVAESALIRDSVLGARTIVSQLDIEIETASAILNHLRNKRDRLHRFVVKHESFLAPIRRLPAELLNYIFSFCLPSPEVSSFNVRNAPLLLTQVCAGWRDSALSSQRLWASFTISKIAPLRDLLMEAWLSRCTSSPLSPCLKLDDQPKQARRMWPVLMRVTQYCDRWRDLILDISASTLSRFGSVRHRLPWLECLAIQLHFGNHSESINVFEFAPRLGAVKLKSVVHPSLFKLPWHQLTDLETSSHYLDALLAILHQSFNLINLKLSSSTSAIGFSSHTTATLPHLLSLDIHMPCSTTALFDKIRCPALQTLHLMITTASWVSDEFIIFLSSCTSLNSLSITHTNRRGSTLDLVPCLQAVPSVTSLRLSIDMEVNWLMEDMLTQMTCTDPTAGCLLPALTKFEVVETALDGRLFAKMLQSRTTLVGPGIAQLKILDLTVKPSLFHFDRESAEIMVDIINSDLTVLMPSYYRY